MVSTWWLTGWISKVMIAVWILTGHRRKGIASEVIPVSRKSGPGITARNTGAVVGWPVESVATGESGGLMLLQLHQGLDLQEKTLMLKAWNILAGAHINLVVMLLSFICGFYIQINLIYWLYYNWRGFTLAIAAQVSAYCQVLVLTRLTKKNIYWN